MGYYLETPGHYTDKALVLAAMYPNVVIAYRFNPDVPRPKWKGSELRKECLKLMEDEGHDIVVVVANPAMGFEAAAYAYDVQELDHFMNDDDRRPHWVLVFPKGVAAKLSGFPDGGLA